MDFGKIISTSFKYPFGDLKHLGVVFILFALTLILPVGFVVRNEIVSICGLIALLIFILISPGYMVSVIKSGIAVSSEVPIISPLRNIIDTFKLLILHIFYVAIPTVIAFLILSSITGLGNFISHPLEYLSNFGIAALYGNVLMTLIGTALVSWLFSLFSFIAMARLAKNNSLVEGLKIHKVLGDIKKIGVLKFFGWYFVMTILIAVLRVIALFLIFVPYAGFVVYVVIVIPILSIIFFCSLGLLYSNSVGGDSEIIDDLDFEINRADFEIKDVNVKTKDDFDFEEFEKEIEYLKYGRFIRK